MVTLRIAIIGAGTAGLATGVALAAHDVTIFERFAAAAPIGSGLLLQPTGLACLAALGLDREVITLGHVIERIHGVTASGRTIFDVAYGSLGANCFGVAIHRASLFDVLWRAAQTARLRIVAASEIVRSTVETDRRWIEDASGTRHGPFDLVIDASGLRSRLRRAEATACLDRPCAYGALWASLEMPADWPGRQVLKQRYEAAHAMCGVLPIGRLPGDARERVAFFWSLRVADVEHWRHASLDHWKARVLALWPDVAPFLDQIRRHDDLTVATYADLRLERPYTDRLIFVGDAARAASPQLGQGANLALIDARVLADVIDHGPTDTVGVRYTAARLSHTRFYGFASRLLTPFFQSDSRIAAHVRDVTFAPMARVPYLRREMVRTLAGMKTGLLTSFDPGAFHPRYALAADARADLARTPA